MTVSPSRKMLGAVIVLCIGSLILIAFPEQWPLLLTANLILFILAFLDLATSPWPAVLQVVRLTAERFSVEHEHLVKLEVENSSAIPLDVRVRDGVQLALTQSALEQRGRVPGQGQITLEYTIQPRSRGRFEWGPIAIRYRSRLGWWELGKKQPPSGAARVFPNLALLERYHLLARTDRLAAMGIRRVRYRGASTEFESLREYNSGDDIRQMDWKATARRARLIVRNQEAERNQTVLLLIDCGRLMNATDPPKRKPDDAAAIPKVDLGLAKLDHAVNAALLLANVALTRGDRVGLCTFSGKVHDWLTPRGNLAQNRLIGETLYDIRGDASESDHARCLKFISARYPKRSLLVVLTDFVDATTSADMVAHLQLAARRHVVLFAAMKDVFLEHASLIDPRTEKEGFRKAAALDLLRERREVLEKIRHAGGFVVDTEPGDVAPAVITNYLEVMLRGLL